MSGEQPMKELLQGGLDALKDYKNLHLSLVGEEQRIQDVLKEVTYPSDRISIVHASDVIEMNDHPVRACKQKPESSLMVGCRALKQGVFDSFFTPGNTGATITAASLYVGRINGVKRPAAGSSYPSLEGHIYILDIGANIDSNARHLRQFAIMGHNYCKYVLKQPNPRIGLLNIGTEESKGNTLTTKAFKLLEKLPYQFCGNVEPADIYNHKVDVVICDGFTGNIFLKTGASTIKAVLQILKKEIKKNLLATIGAFLTRPVFNGLRANLSPNNYGGACLVGVQKPVFIGHGNSDRKAVYSAIRLCLRTLEHNLIQRIEEDIAKWG